MALKFLNKKGWHTGSLRNIENVWKAEQKHDAEQRKLEELRKQIHEERERAEFRLLQQQAGLVPKQERLDFLYESGLGVGKASSSEGFKALEKPLPSDSNPAASSSSSKQQEASVPGALFEEKRQSSNDAWRKLHSDPLLMIRQREQEALARVKNNPVQMAMIRRSVKGMKHKEKSDKKELKKERHRRKSEHRKHSSSKYRGDSESDYLEGEARKNSSNKMCSNYENHIPKRRLDESSEGRHQRKKHCDNVAHPRSGSSDLAGGKGRDPGRSNKKPSRSSRGEFSWEGRADHDSSKTDRDSAHLGKSDMAPGRESLRRLPRNRLSEEERAARLREMLVDAELHEEQRWKRLRKAEEDDAQEAIQEGKSGGRNFLDAAQKSIYGAEKGGCSTIEESVRRRTHYSQGNSDSNGGNAFRR